MATDLYTVNEETQTLVTKTCKLERTTGMLTTDGQMYEVVIADLCRCMLVAIETDDQLGKQAVASALYVVIESVVTGE